MKEAHQVGMGVGVVLLIVLVGGVMLVGYRFYSRNSKPFQFHYFKVRSSGSLSLSGHYVGLKGTK